MEIKNKEVYNKVIKSRVQLLIHYPFYGTLALSLPVIEKPEVKTAATDGKNFYYNPDFINKLTLEETNWIMAHEVMHCALGHLWRRGSRNKEKFNIACDYAIHSILMESQMANTRDQSFKMPEGCLYDKKFDNMSAEEIYDLLPDMPQSSMGSGGNGNQDGNGNSSGSGNGSGQSTLDDHSMWDSPSTQENSQQQQQSWTEKMLSAADVSEAKMQGSVPGGIARLIGAIKKPQKDWRQLLAEFIQFEVFDYGFLPPDKRYYGFSDVLMPDFNEETEKVQDMVFAIDTSGSIGDEELVVVFSELVGMMQQFNNSVKGRIIYVDSKVAAVYDFEDIDDILKAKPAGGGGTDMEEAIRYTMEKQENGEWDVAGMTILTDGWTDYTMTGDEFNFKLLWLVTNEQQTPTYGTVARLKL